jgi:hypothetical protein
MTNYGFKVGDTIRHKSGSGDKWKWKEKKIIKLYDEERKALLDNNTIYGFSMLYPVEKAFIYSDVSI